MTNLMLQIPPLKAVWDNLSNTSVVQYEYDSEGRRDYLVAPMAGSSLASPHLVTDALGDPLQLMSTRGRVRWYG